LEVVTRRRKGKAMDETVFYEDGGVLITNARAILGGVTYSLSGVTSVGMGRQRGNIAPGLAIAIAGVIVFACGGFGLLERGSWLSWVWGILGLGAIIAGIYIVATAKARYTVIVGSSSGEKAALMSTDQAHIAEIVGAMNRAIVGRG